MTRVKICGITNSEDALHATDAGADFLGFILFEKSPRYVSPERVAEIIAAVRAHRPAKPPRCIGVFVNAPLARVWAVIDRAGLDYAQIHGDEPPALLAALDGRGFKALRPTSAAEAQADAEWFAELGPADGPQLLIDAYDPDEYGGTGKKADWHTAAGLARVYPRLMLAGGLTAQNVAQAVATVRPWAVDVSSGVEREPGRKDHQQVTAFIAQAKA